MPRFYATFAGANFHPLTGAPLANAYVELDAEDRDQACELMFGVFSDRWFDVEDHPPKRYTSWDIPPFPIELPDPPLRRKVTTVALRAYLTEEAVDTDTLSLAGRFVAQRGHRGREVDLGAGVWFEDNRYPDDWKRDANSSAIGGAGVVVRVRWVEKQMAEDAVARDPENLSIVIGSESLGVMNRWNAGEPVDFWRMSTLESAVVNDRSRAKAVREGTAPLEVVMTKAEIEKMGTNKSHARCAARLLEEVARVERVRMWRDRLVSVCVWRPPGGLAEVKAVHVDSR